MKDTVLGLDIGTGSTKAVLFDLSGQELATAQADYPLLTPQPGWVEQDPEAVWQALVEVLRQVVNQTGPNFRVLALAMAAQCGSVIPANANGTPVYPMITWMDGRTNALVRQWQADGIEATVRSLSGWWLHPGLPLPTIAWLRQYRPDIFAAAERYLGVNDFLIKRLTGQFCTDHSSAAEMLLVELTNGQWSRSLCALAGIGPEQLSPLAPTGTVIGPITAEVRQLTGLALETVVINGGHDQCCTALALGMTSPGSFKLATGTAWVITGIVDTPSIQIIPAGMDLNFHVVPQRWTVSQLLGGLGASLQWWVQAHGQPAASRAGRYAAFNERVEQSRPGCNQLLFIPLTGAAQVPGQQPWGGFVGLRLDHTQADMGRSVLEGAAFEVRWALESLRQAGLPVERLWLVGGAARSPHWPQILADVTGVPFSVAHDAPWPALGAAILAGVGAGIYDTFEVGQARFQRSARELFPDDAHGRLYDEQFARYQALSRALQGTTMSDT